VQVVGQSQATYTFDNANRLRGISQGSAVGFSYDNANRRTCLTLPNGVIASYGYDNDSRVTSLTYGTGGSCSSPPSNLGNLTHAYDPDGRRTATAGTLAAVTLPSNVMGGTKTTYNADNAQTKFNNTRLSYDSNGNLLSDGTNTYTWDARNHLTPIAQGRTTTATFAYDAFGRRMNKTISGTTTQFLYDRLNPVQELNSSNGVVANLMTSLRIDEYFARTASGTTSTFLGDVLGSTIGLVSANNGPIATNYTYQPFGATTVGGSANGNSYEFTGRENDGTGLYFYRARYYSPTFQRFIAQDPIGFAGGTNLYGYGNEDPINNINPLGLCTDPGGTGIRFCIEQYIPEDSAWGFKGDNRGPNSNGGTFRDQQMLTLGPDGYQSDTFKGISTLWGYGIPATQGPGGAKTGRSCGATNNINAWNNAADGWGLGIFAPYTGYNLNITLNADGQASVTGGLYSDYPNLDVWEYGAGDPRQSFGYPHGSTSPGSLFTDPPIEF
jgi:RHS repeat-associated protein